MELLSNSLVRDLQKQNESLTRENDELRTRLCVMRKMVDTLNNIRYQTQTVIFDHNILMPHNVDHDIKRWTLEYESLERLLDDTNDDHLNRQTDADIADMEVNMRRTGGENNIEMNAISLETVKCEPFESEDCDRMSSAMSTAMSRAVNDVESESLSEFACDEQNCGIVFSNAFKLAIHKKCHVSKQTETLFRCHTNGCAFVTKCRNNLYRHANHCKINLNNRDNDFSCDYNGCDLSFSSLLQLRKHKQIHKVIAIQVMSNSSVNNNNSVKDNSVNDKMEIESYSGVKKRRSNHQKYTELVPNEFGGYTCYYEECQKMFKDKLRLVYHLRTHTDERPYACDYPNCNKTFKTPSQIINHKLIHSGKKHFKCEETNCFREFATKSQLIHHRKRYHSGINFVCEYFNCQMSFVSRREWKSHQTLHKKNQSSNVSKKSNLKSNLKVSNGKQKKSLISLTNVPQNVYDKRRSGAIRRNRNLIETDNKFMCGFVGCDKAFRTSNELISHNKLHSDINYVNFSKPNAFSSFGCAPLQPNVNVNKSELTHAINSTDKMDSLALTSQSEVFKCGFCQKLFNNRSQFKAHMKTHEKPYLCEFDDCNKRFGQKTQLMDHIRIHTGEKPYVCDSIGCDKKFKTVTQLKQHVIIHTGLKPYNCEVFDCHKNFATKSQLIHHRKRSHPEMMQLFQRSQSSENSLT